ncbi:MAG: hypothetical protein HY235_06700 [Acidobacteria bacterium]|nr:hypothetical protein [Acidobacteriota bacterium]
MDQASLVDKDIALGKRLAELLKKASGVRLEAAFWWQEEDEWRFIVATPVVHKRGRLVAYKKIQEVVGAKANEFQPILTRLDVLSPSEGVMTVLDIGSLGQIPLNRQILDEGVRGVYVHGAYFYYFAPHTFAPV